MSNQRLKELNDFLRAELAKPNTQPAPQVPMTEAAAENLATTSWILNCLLNPWDELNNGDEQSSVLPDMVRLIRAVEAFHGIKEQP